MVELKAYKANRSYIRCFFSGV